MSVGRQRNGFAPANNYLGEASYDICIIRSESRNTTETAMMKLRIARHTRVSKVSKCKFIYRTFQKFNADVFGVRELPSACYIT